MTQATLSTGGSNSRSASVSLGPVLSRVRLKSCIGALHRGPSASRPCRDGSGAPSLSASALAADPGGNSPIKLDVFAASIHFNDCDCCRRGMNPLLRLHQSSGEQFMGRLGSAKS
jgi:hypothetical protein